MSVTAILAYTVPQRVMRLPIVTPAPLHTLAKALKAVSALLLQFLQMYCSTSVALEPLQTAFKAEGSDWVLRCYQLLRRH